MEMQMQMWLAAASEDGGSGEGCGGGASVVELGGLGRSKALRCHPAQALSVFLKRYSRFRFFSSLSEPHSRRSSPSSLQHLNFTMTAHITMNTCPLVPPC